MSVDAPISIWRTTDGLTDSVYTGKKYIVDAQDFYLVDPDGDYVVDTGIEMPKTPVTLWTEDDSI